MKSVSNKKNVTLTVSMSNEMLQDITEIAESSGLTRSAFACSLIYNGLLEYKSKIKAMDSLPDIMKSALDKYAEKLDTKPFS
jgi:hypothetical protein